MKRLWLILVLAAACTPSAVCAQVLSTDDVGTPVVHGVEVELTAAGVYRRDGAFAEPAAIAYYGLSPWASLGLGLSFGEIGASRPAPGIVTELKLRWVEPAGLRPGFATRLDYAPPPFGADEQRAGATSIATWAVDDTTLNLNLGAEATWLGQDVNLSFAASSALEHEILAGLVLGAEVLVSSSVDLAAWTGGAQVGASVELGGGGALGLGGGPHWVDGDIRWHWGLGWAVALDP